MEEAYHMISLRDELLLGRRSRGGSTSKWQKEGSGVER